MTAISPRQRGLLDEWLGTWQVVADHSWPLQSTTVLRVRSADGDHIVKAVRAGDSVRCEIDAFTRVLSELDAPVPRLEHHDAGAGVLVIRYLPGEIVEATPAEWEPGTYRQAGEILAKLQVPGEVSADHADQALASIRKRLAEADGLVPDAQLAAIRTRIAGFRSMSVRLCFTHGDYQPRNWLIHDGTVSVIDFGRGAQRSWVSDLVRLRSQQFAGHPDLEDAFMRGLGRPVTGEDAVMLELETVKQSLGTVVWAHGIGDPSFEEHGRGMIARYLVTLD